MIFDRYQSGRQLPSFRSHMQITAAIATLVLAFFLYVIHNAHQTVQRLSRECDQYGNLPARDIPARCLAYFEMGKTGTLSPDVRR